MGRARCWVRRGCRILFGSISNGIRKSFFIEDGVTRGENMTREWIKTPISFVIARETEMYTWEGARGKFVRGSGGDIGKT
jgi:hypothetical protein